MFLSLMYITNDPDVALVAEKSGVERIMIDLETLGKDERQKNMDTVKSHHSIDDIKRVARVLTSAKMLVRVNPINQNSEKEISAAINAGAEILMLPMWRTASDVRRFVDLVAGRAKTVLLLENKDAAECIDEVLVMGGFDEIHIGLNDLHLSMGLTFMFELLANGTVEGLCEKIAKSGVPYGFGGIARIGEGMLPAEKIIMEHFRLGSTRAILSRSFCDLREGYDRQELERIFDENMLRLREYADTLSGKTDADYARNRQEINACVNEIVAKMKERQC